MSYRKPGSTDINTGSGRTTRRRRTFIDPAMATLEATRGFTEKFDKRINDVRDYENEVAQRNINLQDKVEGLKGLEDLNPFSYLQDDLMDMVSNINKLDIESFEGDRSAYNKELSKINRILNNYQSFVGGLDATIDEYQTKSATELHRDISRTALQNDPRVAKYRKFLDNPSKAKFKIEDGEMVVYNGDERLFNAVEFVNSTKKGFQMVPYTPDMSDKIAQVQNENYKGLDDLTKKIIDVEIKGKNKDYNSLTSTEKINYEKAIDAYVDRLKNDPAVDALVNESTFQRFITGNDVYDKIKDESRTKDELIKFMVKKQFAGGEEVDVAVKERLAAKPRTRATTRATSSDAYIPDVNEIVQGISNLKNDPEKGQTYFIGKKIKGREINKVKVDGNSVTFTTRSVTPGGKTVDKEETYNLNNTNSINNLEDDLLKTIIGSGRDAQKARTYAHSLTNQLISDKEDFSISKQVKSLTMGQWEASEEDLVGSEDKDDKDYKKGTLYQLYPNFEFEQSGFGTNRVIAKTKDGKNKTKELVTGKKEDLKVLLDFIEKHSNTSESNSLAKAQALIEMYKK